MKKNLYSILILLFPLSLLAQPTITQGDLPVAGLAFVMATDSPTTATILPGGVNQTWDYSTIGASSTDTSAFIDASGTPYASSFPGSTIASYNADDTSYSYFLSTTDGFYVSGFANSTMIFPLSPAQLFAPVPFTYTNTVDNVSRYVKDTTIAIYNFRFVINITTHFEADGYGDLILPNGTYPNTLRIRYTQTTYDSTINLTLGSVLGSSASQVTYYRWFRHGSPAAYVFGIEADSLGQTALTSEYLTTFTTGVPVLANVSGHLISYPNPATSEINLSIPEMNGDADIYVYNSFGQIVKSIHTNNSTHVHFDVAEFPNGKYYYSLHSDQKLLNGNFTVIH